MRKLVSRSVQARIEKARQRVGANLRATRRDRGLTILQVRELTGLSESFLSRVERGTVNVSLDTLVRLAAVYGCDEVELLAATAPAAGLGAGSAAGPTVRGSSGRSAPRTTSRRSRSRKSPRTR